MSKENKIVAIESTQDYTDTKFHQRLVDTDIMNKDGSYGKVVDSYRIADLNDEGRIKAFDDRVFSSYAETKAAIEQNPALKLISYDALVNEAGRRITEQAIAKATKNADVRPWTPKTISNEKNKNLDKER